MPASARICEAPSNAEFQSEGATRNASYVRTTRVVRFVPAASTDDVTRTPCSRMNSTRIAVGRMSRSSGEERNEETDRTRCYKGRLAQTRTVCFGGECLNAREVTRGDMRVTRQELPLRQSRSLFSNALGSGIVGTRRSGGLAAEMEDPIQGTGSVRFATFELDVRSRELRERSSRVRLQDQPFE